MRIIDLKGDKHNWPPPGYAPLVNDTRPRSELHLRARALLKRIFPTQRILEEVPVSGTSLHFDFVLPNQMLVVEVQGQQHDKHIPFFQTRAGFNRARANDNTKKEWCNLNNIILIELLHNESDEEWQNKLQPKNN